MDFSDAVLTFLLDLRLDGRAIWTLRKHHQELRRYGRHLESAGLDWLQVTTADVRVYARGRAHLGHSARGATFCSLRVFYAWAVGQGLVAMSPAAGLRTPRRPHPQPKALHPAHIRQLISYLVSQEGLRGRRDECLLLVALYTGLRAAELARLRWGDVDLDSGVITIHLSKWNHGRNVPIHADLRPILLAWQVVQALGPNAPVFSSAHDGAAIAPAPFEGAQAWVTNPAPFQNSIETVCARLIVNGQVVQGALAAIKVHYKSKDTDYTGVTGDDGVAPIAFNISRATKGYPVMVDVTVGSAHAQTSFTPQ